MVQLISKELFISGTSSWIGLSKTSDAYLWHNGIDFSVTYENIGKNIIGSVATNNQFVMRQNVEDVIEFASFHRSSIKSVICQGNLDEIDMLLDLS